MKQSDFDRLKAVCEKEGFDIKHFSINPESFIIEPKDIWDGVEFAEYGKTFLKVNKIVKDTIFASDGNRYSLLDCLPSTESAYIEQLKEEAFKRFGEIKDGDRFRSPNNGLDTRCNNPRWVYTKEFDWLYYGTCMLYKQGKWATKVKERVKVTYEVKDYFCDSLVLKFWTGYTNDPDAIGKFLASKLEEYLNSKE